MMHVWTIAWGHTLFTTSGSPLSPSHTTKNESRTPRVRRSVSTDIQNFAPSPPVPAHNPRTSFSPARVTPIAAYMGRLATCPSRTLTMIASMKIAAYTGSNGRVDHVCISSITASVMRLIVSLDTLTP